MEVQLLGPTPHLLKSDTLGWAQHTGAQEA